MFHEEVTLTRTGPFILISMSSRLLRLAAACASLLACAEERRVAPPPDPSPLLTSALEAELAAANCSPIRSVDTLPASYFPEVTLVRGTCTAEHGDVISRIAGIDATGVIYVLDSPSAFWWLVTRHPPTLPAAGPLQDYAALALTLMGYTDARADVVRDASTLPREVLANLSRVRVSNLPIIVLGDDDWVSHLVLTTFDGLRLVSHDVRVYRARGTVMVFPEVIWTARRIH